MRLRFRLYFFVVSRRYYCVTLDLGYGDRERSSASGIESKYSRYVVFAFYFVVFVDAGIDFLFFRFELFFWKNVKDL